ncbi:uncharacterized protein SPPG_03279 [Spizellomyces punctatus DAOM BR117]|uniref:RING-type domain-containing protein n=1 Tax=Spizellomyces punctatus (strain DAOM BR117) TaxID=645134 RepID=A0A0L0HKW3_SPIPD|nr:uncharacterized protein SPPG_03279 [Spizellomyces punctatus DAOM BR117]KND01479.1 hypothetical protein SPPG_03279 [Spizellomyces punctatus DAOM BR117]|eukprot:XP_016609518.1 hypothetical protein SPPG_03279 [Spizellomyces punctatus DAOM BR117]
MTKNRSTTPVLDRRQKTPAQPEESLQRRRRRSNRVMEGDLDAPETPVLRRSRRQTPHPARGADNAHNDTQSEAIATNVPQAQPRKRVRGASHDTTSMLDDEFPKVDSLREEVTPGSLKRQRTDAWGEDIGGEGSGVESEGYHITLADDESLSDRDSGVLEVDARAPSDVSTSPSAIIDLTSDTTTLPNSTHTDTTRMAHIIDLSTPVVSQIRNPVQRSPSSEAVFDLTQEEDDDLQVLHHIPGVRLPSVPRAFTSGMLELGADTLSSPEAGGSVRAWIESAFSRMLGTGSRSVPNDNLHEVGGQSPLQPQSIRSIRPRLPSFNELQDNLRTTVARPQPPPPPPEPENPAALKCAICLGTFSVNTNLSATICGHIYCEDCIKDVLKVKKECPMCRRPLKGKNSIHRLYIS